MRRLFRRLAIVIAATMVLTYAGGCASTSTTQAEAKKAAKARWELARANILYSMAAQQFDVGDLDKSEKTIAQALSMAPKQPAYHDLAARIFMERGQLERASHAIEESIKIDEKREKSHYIMAMIFQRWQQYEPAYQEYKLAYEAKADDVSPLMAMAEMLVKLNRAPEAAALLESKLAYFDHNPAIRATLGRIYLMQHQNDKAMSMLKLATLLAPEDQSILEQLTMAEYASGHWPDAIDHLKVLLKDKKFADRHDLYSSLGDCYMATQQPAVAREIFLKITHDNPNDVDAWIKLAEAAWTVGDNVRVGMATHQIISLAPQRHEGYLLSGMVEMRAGHNDKALTWFDRAASLAPETTSPLIMKGMTLEQLGRRTEAAVAYRTALKVNPNDSRAQRLLAGVDQ